MTRDFNALNVEYELEKLRYCIYHELDRRELCYVKDSIQVYKHLSGNMVAEIESFIWQQKLDTITYQVPVNKTYETIKIGFRHLKIHIPLWERVLDFLCIRKIKHSVRTVEDLITRIPIRMKTETLDVSVIYPKLKIACPNEQKVFKIIARD